MIPQLQPGNIIIIDNATCHKGQSIQEIVEKAKCEIWYLPAYSPDFNKIENWWAVLKTWMRQRKLGSVGFRPAKVFKKRLKEFKTVRECVDAAFKNCPNVCA